MSILSFTRWAAGSLDDAGGDRQADEDLVRIIADALQAENARDEVLLSPDRIVAEDHTLRIE